MSQTNLAAPVGALSILLRETAAKWSGNKCLLLEKRTKLEEVSNKDCDRRRDRTAQEHQAIAYDEATMPLFFSQEAYLTLKRVASSLVD